MVTLCVVEDEGVLVRVVEINVDGYVLVGSILTVVIGVL